MAGLDPVIHVFLPPNCKDVDARDKPGHDECATGVSRMQRSALAVRC
jgi:hypothetical protein